MNKSSNVTRYIIVIAIILLIGSLYSIFMLSPPKKPLNLAGDYIKYQAVPIGGSFTLTDQNNKQISDTDLNNKLKLIYFGFTYCPSICPAALNTMKKVLETLDIYKIEIYPIFISIDPKRDKPDLLKRYLHDFHPKIIGLTGTEEEIKEVAEKFKAYYMKEEGDNTENYNINHSSFFYLMDKQGNYITHFPLQSDYMEMVEAIRIHNNDK